MFMTLVALAALPGTLRGQGGMPPAVVRYTEAREHQLKRLLTLPGSVEALKTSTLAASVPGLVVDFPAKEGMRIERGQVLARVRSTTLELMIQSQKAALKEAEARWKLAESNLKRAKDLYDAGVVSKQQYDDAQSEFNAWVGRTDSLKADIARLEDDLERCTIRAPFDAVVVRELTEVGEWVIIGGPVVEVLLIEQVEIRVEVPERYFSSLQAGAAATVTFESLPDLTAPGRVIAIIPRADPQARTFPVKVRVNNESGRIGAGMLAQVAFAAGETYRATIVPKDAVISRGAQKMVYRVNGDSKVEEVGVETGAGAGVWIEVRGPLRAGDKVVTRGNERIGPGQTVAASALEYKKPS